MRSVEWTRDRNDEGFTSFRLFLSSHGIRVRDFSELMSKMGHFRAEGPGNFQLVSDFDRTLTPQWLREPCSETGKLVACHSSHGVIESSPFMSSHYVNATRQLAEYYIPLEHDHRLDFEQKKHAVEEWYHKAHDCMLEEEISREKLCEMVTHAWSSCEIHLRHKTTDLCSFLRHLNIPVTILSAGVADVIEGILKLENIASGEGSNTMVVGNRLIFREEDGKHVGFSEPMIHSLNKRDALKSALCASAVRAERPNAVVMGDLIGDVDFVHSIPHLQEYIAIGFLADPRPADVPGDHEDRVNTYLKHFDIVILNGAASMDVVLELLTSVFS